MEIVKTFYSLDKMHRSSICKRTDGLYDYYSEELEQDYYIDDDGQVISLDDYYWRGDNEGGSITDSLENAEKILKEDFVYECFEAPCVDEMDDIELKDGRTGKVIEITSKGDYVIAINDLYKEKMTVSIRDIIKVL